MPTQSAADLPSPTPLMQTIIWGTQWEQVDLSVAFVSGTSSFEVDGFDSEGFTAHERDQFLAALGAISAVSGLTFTEVTDPDGADIALILDTDQASDLPPGEAFLGFFYPPFENGPQSAGVFNASGEGWDRFGGGGLEFGGYGYVTIVHELLHGMGLAHPHDNGGGSPILLDVTSDFDDYGRNDLNQGLFTTMSYNSGAISRYSFAPRHTDLSYGYEYGPMVLDIAVLQSLYGANMEHRTGADDYVLDTVNDVGTGWTAIWDAGGEDSIRHEGDANALIDLRPATLQYGEGGGGYVSTVEGIQGGFTIAFGVEIEDAMGGGGDDTINGNHLGNDLTGVEGRDTLSGRGGADVLYGGADNDRLYGGTEADVLMTGSGDDTAVGGSGADTIMATSGTNTLSGGSGADVITGGTGADTINGGSGNDTLSGGAGADWLFGGRGRDTLDGGEGADELVGGLGTDTLIGGAGNDSFVFYYLSDSRVGQTVSDIIMDFTEGDLIDLSGIDADLTVEGDQAFTFVGTSLFSGTSPEVRVIDTMDGSGVVLIDRAGSGAEDMEIRLNGVTSLTAEDFIL